MISSAARQLTPRSYFADVLLLSPFVYAPTTPPDTTPDQFPGETKAGQALSATVTFTAVTPVGYTSATTINITGGTYSINGGSYVSSSGTLSPGDSFTVRHTSSASYLTAVDSVITLDGTVTGTYRSITTIDPAYTSSRIKINNGFGFGF